MAQNLVYHTELQKFLQTSSSTSDQDTINMQDERPTIIIGTNVEDRDENVPPFYVTLTIHDKLLQNCMLDLGASHNLMPKVVTKEIGLEITKSYHDHYSFDSRSVQCIGLIKYLVVILTQLPMKSIDMDIVVAYIPAKYGMLLLRFWAIKLGGTLQMDMTYATVQIFNGDKKRLYRENKLKYVVNNGKKLKMFLVYVVEYTMDCFQLEVSGDFEDKERSPIVLTQHTKFKSGMETFLWWGLF